MCAARYRRFRPRAGKKKRFMWLLLILPVLGIFLYVAFPRFVSSDKGRRLILQKVNRSIAGTADFASLSMGWFKGLELKDLKFVSDSGSMRVAVKRIFTKPRYLSILSGALSLGRTIIDEPAVDVRIGDIESLQRHPAGSSPEHQDAGGLALPIGKVDLVVNDGSLKVNVGAEESPDRTVELRRINGSINLQKPAKVSSFEANATVVEDQNESKVYASGQIRSESKQWFAEGISGQFLVEVNSLDLSTLSPLFAVAGAKVEAKGVLSAKIKAGIEKGALKSVQAAAKGVNIDIKTDVFDSDVLTTDQLSAMVDLQADREMIRIERLDIKTDWLDVNAAGVVPKTMRSLTEFVKPDSPHNLTAQFNCDLAEAMSQLPHVLGLKENINVTAGRLSGNISTTALPDRRIIEGYAKLWALEGKFPIKSIILSKPIEVDARIASTAEGVNIEKLKADSAFANIECQGKVNDFAYSAEVDLAKAKSDLGQFMEFGYGLEGIVKATGNAKVNSQGFQSTGSSTLTGVRVTSDQGNVISEPSAVLSYDLAVDTDQKLARVNEFGVALSDGGRVRVSDSVIPFTEASGAPFVLNLAAQTTLEQVQRYGSFFGVSLEEVRLAGALDAQEIKVTRSQDNFRLLIDKTTIRNLKVTSPNRKPFEQDPVTLVCDVLLDLSKEGIEKLQAINAFQLSSPQIKIKRIDAKQTSGSGNTSFTAQGQAEYDLEAVSGLVSSFLPSQLKIQGRRDDAFQFVSVYPSGQRDKILSNMSGKADFGFDRAEFMGFDFGKVNSGIQIDKGKVHISPFSTTVNKGVFKLPEATADFTQPATVLKVLQPTQIMKDVQINDIATRKLLGYVNPIFANAVNVTGTGNLHCETLAIPLAGADKNALHIEGTISLENVRLQSSDLLVQIFELFGTRTQTATITMHPTRFTVQNGIIRYDDMQIDVGDNPVNFRGAIGLDKSMNMTIVLPYTFEGRTVGQARSPGERISLVLKGTVDKPKLDVGKLLQDEAKKAIEQQLRKGLEKIFE
ncbi:MAG: hypothetical protein ABIG61_06925 [Planctomycetota bacterium]